jgi:aspartate/methionine/tyrosine aminotransferase
MPVAYPLFLAKLLIRTGIARFLPGVQRLTEGGGDFLHYYSNRILTSPFADLKEAAPLLESHGPETIDLALGAPRFDLAPSGSTKLPAERQGLPPIQGLPELRDAIAVEVFEGHGLPVRSSDEVLVTHGAAGAFGVALECFINRGDRVALFDPASPLFLWALKYRRARVHWIPTWSEEGRLRFRLDQLARALQHARLVVVNSPANPTGGVIAAEDMEQIAWWAHRHDVLIYYDGVFDRYHYEDKPFSIGSLDKARQRSLIAGSLSKGHGLASARVGWLAGYRHLIRPCTLASVLQTPFVPTLSQQVALAALRQGSEPFQPIRKEFAARRRYAYERLLALDLKPVWPAGAFFLWVPVRELGLDGRTFAEQVLKAKRVLVWPGCHFGPSGADFVRLSYATEDGRLREGLSRLAEFVRELQGSPPPGKIRLAA